MNIFDIHCDTPFEMYRRGLRLDNSTLAVSIKNAEEYTKKLFVTAFWSDKDKEADECYREFLESSSYLDECIQRASGKAALCKCKDDIVRCAKAGMLGAIKAVEGGRLLGDDLSRLDILYRYGVRVFLPLWGGSERIGGAWDTKDGLSDFGREVVLTSEHLGMIVDTSHMSKESFWDTAELCKRPIIASHSNFFAICPHGRNLDDERMRYVISNGGIIGLNLCCAHVSSDFNSRMPGKGDDFVGKALRHIYYCLENGGEKSICLGSDWDGTAHSEEIPNVSYASLLYDRMIADGVGKNTADNIFFNNAYNFFINNM